MTSLLLALLDLLKRGFEWAVDGIWQIVLALVAWALSAGQTLFESILGEADWLPDIELGDWFYDNATWLNEWVPLDLCLTLFIAYVAFEATVIALRMARSFILLGA